MMCCEAVDSACVYQYIFSSFVNYVTRAEYRGKKQCMFKLDGKTSFGSNPKHSAYIVNFSYISTERTEKRDEREGSRAV